MPWCPKCRTEYVEGIKTCSDCSSELVDKLEEEAEPEYDREAFLTSAGGSMEADMIEALLTSNEIPVMKKYRDAGDYMNIYMGGTIYTVDIYVPSRLLDKAREVIQNMQFTDAEVQGAEDAEASEEEAQEEYEGAEADSIKSDDSKADGNEADEKENDRIGNNGYKNSDEADASGSSEELEFAEEEKKYDRKRRIRTWIIILFFVPGLIWVLYAFILGLISWISK